MAESLLVMHVVHTRRKKTRAPADLSDPQTAGRGLAAGDAGAVLAGSRPSRQGESCCLS